LSEDYDTTVLNKEEANELVGSDKDSVCDEVISRDRHSVSIMLHIIKKVKGTTFLIDNEKYGRVV
jgi:hypothetical protein